MSDKGQKRRKLWAVVDDDGRGSQVFTSWRAAKAWAAKEPRDGTGWRVIPFIELRRGDVLLSREEADALRELAARVDNSIPLKWGKSPPDAKCFKCHGTGKYTWEDGHNGDEHESACNCTIPVVLTSGEALARFRGGR